MPYPHLYIPTIHSCVCLLKLPNDIPIHVSERAQKKKSVLLWNPPGLNLFPCRRLHRNHLLVISCDNRNSKTDSLKYQYLWARPNKLRVSGRVWILFTSSIFPGNTWSQNSSQIISMQSPCIKSGIVLNDISRFHFLLLIATKFWSKKVTTLHVTNPLIPCDYVKVIASKMGFKLVFFSPTYQDSNEFHFHKQLFLKNS